MWKNIKDELPTVNTYVLITDGKLMSVGKLTKDYFSSEAYWDYEATVSGHDRDTDLNTLTHWMLLPELPKTK